MTVFKNAPLIIDGIDLGACMVETTVDRMAATWGRLLPQVANSPTESNQESLSVGQ